MGEHTESKQKKRRWWAFGLALLGAALLLVLGRYLYVMFLDPMSAFDPPAPAPVLTPPPALTVAPGEPTPEPTPTLSPEELLQMEADMEFMKNRVNILLLGWDQSPEREDEDSALYRDENNNYRSDVIMLFTADFDTGAVDLISIPRDTYAPIYNTKGRWKINAAFAKGGSAEGEGFEYAMHTVSDLLGVPIDHYAGVDMSGLKAVVDAMGGVDYDVDVRIELNGRVLEEGYQHLDGQQVLDYCRARKGITGTNSKGANSDVGRADRQQRMLFAIFEQLKSTNQLVNIPSIYASVKDKVHTNLNSEQIAALAVFAMKLDMEDLDRHTLDGEYVNDVYNASFYVLRNKELQALVKEVFGIEIDTNPRYDLGYVKADRKAQTAMAYVEGADALLSLLSLPVDSSGAYRDVPEDVAAVQEAALAVAAVAQHTAPAGASEKEKEAILDEALDEAAIESSYLHLRETMYALCIRYGITQAHVTKNDLPREFYDLLPDTPEGILIPSGTTPAPEQEPAPETTPEAAPEAAPEVVPEAMPEADDPEAVEENV